MLPVTVPIMFLMVYWWEDFTTKKMLLRVALIFPAIVFVAYFAVFSTGQLDYNMNSDKYILEALMENKENKNLPIYYWKEKNYSGQFYTNGKAQLIKEASQFDSVFKFNKKIILITLKIKQTEIPKKYLDQMILTESNYKTAIFVKR
tara:strand:+ start:157 stop:597 length:441 start_codon:yes stop_codon:yes gene_type:complete